MDFTSKGLKKPQPAEFQKVSDLNDNADRVNDYGMGAFICTSTTRPTGSDRWDGLFIKETDTNRLYVWSAGLGRWCYYGGGGHGDPAPAGGSNGIDFNTAPYIQYTGTDRQPLEVIRTVDGDAQLSGTFTNSANTAWTVNIQNIVAKLHANSAAFIPPFDAVIMGSVLIGGVTGGDPAMYIVRGSGAGSGYSGVAGDIIFQGTITRAGPYTAGTVKWQIPPLKWKLVN